MKKILFAFAMVAFLGGTAAASINSFSNNNVIENVEGEKEKDKEKKKKKKKEKKAKKANCSSGSTGGCCAKAKTS